ncbi:class I SAM-dependent methyltransferase [Actinokineospora sp. NBRC 105648]|uniref:class I SAM-dependent methyltransferase n=1 Tax=Actinokineospora sp. NBRC 105648 TaxID=3032206 RepID=UPI0024A26359|nr:class I SAM-dependent methyltransferase [Actinokineospora sp. NBRC 105648]GLZ39573.1 hypothetical protein Acsp05_31970 [Actinokineospora sp. NBRC 105648]
MDARQAIAAVFDQTADTYDALGVDFFGVFARTLLDDVGPIDGLRVLDAGCGRGAVLFQAAERVGPQGSVVGIDLAPQMVTRTEAEATECGIENVSVLVSDAQEPTVAGPFDVVLSSCVIFFLPNPAAALRAWHSLLTPDGILGLTTFGGIDPRWAPIDELFAPYVPEPLAQSIKASPFNNTDHVNTLVADAGFADPTSVTREHDVRFDSPQHWVDWSWSHGQRLFWGLVPESERDAVTTGILDHLRTLSEPDGSVVLHQPVRYTIAWH